MRKKYTKCLPKKERRRSPDGAPFLFMDTVKIIQDYIQRIIPEPSIAWPIHEIQRRSYARWAAFELLDRVSDHPFTPANEIAGRFLFDLMLCAGSPSSIRYFIVCTAMDTTEDILLHFDEGEHYGKIQHCEDLSVH